MRFLIILLLSSLTVGVAEQPCVNAFLVMGGATGCDPTSACPLSARNRIKQIFGDVENAILARNGFQELDWKNDDDPVRRMLRQQDHRKLGGYYCQWASCSRRRLDETPGPYRRLNDDPVLQELEFKMTRACNKARNVLGFIVSYIAPDCEDFVLSADCNVTVSN